MNGFYKEIFEFTNLAGKLKEIERFKGQFYWRDYPKPTRYESPADHSWRLALLVILFADQLSQKLDLEKALKMAVVHDLHEVVCGDASPVGEDGDGNKTYAFNKKIAKQKSAREIKGAKKIFAKLPRKQAADLYKIWLEYEQAKSFEAKVVKSLDKIEASIQVLQYRQGHMFPEHLEFTAKYGTKGSEVDPAIHEFGQFIVQELRKKYREFKKQ